MRNRWKRLFLFPIITGLAGGIAAAAMEWGLHVGIKALIGDAIPKDPFAVFQFHWAFLVLPALGGLVCGLVVPRLCPGTKGQGTDTLIHAFHRNNGELGLRGPLVKGVAAVGVISCGGSAGPEGPIAALGAALGSTCGRLFGVPPRQLRILLLAGCAAGIGAIFRCPLGGALFAVGVVYSEPDYESEAIIPSVISSVLGYSVFMALWGHGEPLIQHARNFTFTHPLDLIPYAVLGLACGLVTMLFTGSLQGIERLAHKMEHYSSWMMPALGGLATGIIACLIPQVMDIRYEFVQKVMDGNFWGTGPVNWWWYTGLFAMVVVAKCVATSCTVGSGASGGVLGPALFIGGMTGACVGALLEAQFPGTFPEPLRRALIPVGMAGVLAAGMRTPLAAAVMVVEMTESYGLIVPLMVVCTMAYVVTTRWGLNSEQVPTSSQSPVHSADTVVHLLEALRVKDFLLHDWKLVVPPTAGLKEMIERTQPGEQPTFAVVRNRSLFGRDHASRSGPDHRRRGIGAGGDRPRYHARATRRLVARRQSLSGVGAVSHASLQRAAGRGRQDAHVAGDADARAGVRSSQAAQRRGQGADLREHAGLFAADEDAQLDEFLAAVAPLKHSTLQRLMVPIEVVGQSIRQAQFQRRYGHQIVGIEAEDGSLHSPPDLDRPLASGDRLLAIVERGTNGEAPATGQKT